MDKLWDSISLLMEKSFWGQHADMDSLKKNIDNEVQELYVACQNLDERNAKEETADVLMIACCMLYQVLKERNYDSSEIGELVVKKIHRRYAHLFDSQNQYYGKEEHLIWEKGKKKEHKAAMIFCDNLDCCDYGKMDFGNITIERGTNHIICKSCKRKIICSNNNTMFYKCQNAYFYLKNINQSVLRYSRGNIEERICLYFWQNI
ncbi:MAG: hypothetical protein IJ733_02620 [Lachnospiraceae bacterium]|nr:hypothetical protein [Lachnospiraceae bacterium]